MMSIFLPSNNYIELIFWKIRNRDSNCEECLIPTVNSSIIIDCAVFIEGFINLFLNEYVNHKLVDEDLKKYFSEKLADAPFYAVQKYFELFSKMDFKSTTDEKTIAGVNHLFQLRNIIVHGNELTFDHIFKGTYFEIVGTGKIKKTFDYLQQVRIYPRKFNEFSEFSQFFTNENADFFFEITRKFAKDFSESVKHFELGFVNDYFELNS